MSVEQAREVYAENMMGYTMGRSAPYAARLQFPVVQGGTADPDENMGVAPVLRQAVGKVKDMVTGGGDPEAHEPGER